MNSKDPLISILLPFYNSKSTLEQCLISLINQTYKNIEIILIDDCSNDDSYELIKKYINDKNIKYLKTKFNVGPFAAKNFAFEYTKGSYISFHDADDISHPERIEKQIRPLINKRCLLTSCLIIRTHLTEFLMQDINNFENIIKKINSKRLHTVNKIYKYCCQAILGLVTAMFHRNLLIKMKYLFNNIRHSADAEFYERFLYVTTGKLINDEDIHYMFWHNIQQNHLLIDEPLYYSLEMNNKNISKSTGISNRKLIKNEYQTNLRNNFKTMNFINFYFSKIFVINLKKDTSKRQDIIEKFGKYNINFEFVDAVYGYDKPHIDNYKNLKNKKFKNPGAFGYMETWKKILIDCINNNYNRILCFDDDVMLCNNFNKKFCKYIESINNDFWKILNLGVSQYVWKDIDMNKTVSKNWYHPPFDTDGSFAIGINKYIFKELYDDLIKYDNVFDTGPLRNIYKKYPKYNYVAYPNLVIADLFKSEINKVSERQAIDQINIYKWKIKKYK